MTTEQFNIILAVYNGFEDKSIFLSLPLYIRSEFFKILYAGFYTQLK